jgi:hypothetical protein
MVPYYDVRLKQRRVEILVRSNAFRGHELNLVDMERTRAVIREEEPDVIICPLNLLGLRIIPAGAVADSRGIPILSLR